MSDSDLPETMSQKDMAALLGISSQALKKAAKAKRAAIARREKRRIYYNVRETLALYEKTTDPAKQRKTRAKGAQKRELEQEAATVMDGECLAGDDDDDYQAARTKKTRADAELSEMKAAKARGDLISRGTMEEAIFDVMRTAREQWLNAPSRFTGLVAEEDMPKVAALIHEILDDTITGLERLKE